MSDANALAEKRTEWARERTDLANHRTDKAGERTEMARDRTDLAQDRTILANERTFAGWVRTGMGAMVVAIAIQALFGPTDQVLLAKGAALLMLVIAVICFITSFVAARSMLARVSATMAEPCSPARMGWTAGLLTAAAVALGILLWLI